MNQVFSDFVALVDLQLCWKLTLSLLHSIWQVAILGLVVAFVCRANSTLNVHRKFAVAFSILMLMGVTPLLNFAWLDSSEPISSAASSNIHSVDQSQNGAALFELDQLSQPNQPDGLDQLDRGHATKYWFTESSDFTTGELPVAEVRATVANDRIESNWVSLIPLSVCFSYLHMANDSRKRIG